MNHKKLAVLLCLAASSAMASSIVLYDTGVTDSTNSVGLVGVDSTANVFDPHFTTNPGAQAYTFGIFPGYVDESLTGAARWITTGTCGQPSASGGCNVTPTLAGNSGVYDYIENFTLPSAGSVTISGIWASDDCAEIFLNGDTGVGIGGGVTSTNCTVQSSNFTNFPRNFSVTANLGSGANAIDFEVYNAFLSTALLVTNINGTFTQAGATPEPASLGLSAVGLALLAFGRMRKRRQP